MKKQKVSVFKPRNTNISIKKKTSPKNVTKVVKNIVKNTDSVAVAPHGLQKPKILSIQSFNIGGNLIKTINKAQEPVKVVEKETISEMKVENSESKTSKTNVVPDAKMAKLPKNSKAATRGQLKKEIKTKSAQIAVKKMKNIKPKVKPVKKNANVNLKKRDTLKNIIKAESAQKAAAKKLKIMKPKDEPAEEIAEVKLENVEEPAKKIPQENTCFKKHLLKQKTKLNIANTGNLKLTKEHVANSIQAVLQLSEQKLKSKKSLLPIENEPVLLQIACIKIPKTPKRQIRLFLPHALVGPLDDVAIFVPDIQKGRRQDYEKTVEHWENIFREKNVDCIKEIIPLNRVLTEYTQFEMKRKLTRAFDFFLADGRISGHLMHLLGRNFFKRTNPPTPVKMMKNDLKEEFESALHRSCLQIHSLGNTHTMQVGTISMDAEKLAENIWVACEALASEYPGGWENIRAIYLKTNTASAVPIYYTFVSKNKVSQPIVKAKRPKAYRTVKGELTTIPGRTTVTVTPEGKITIKRKRDIEDEENVDKKLKNDEADKKEDNDEEYDYVDDENDEDQQ